MQIKNQVFKGGIITKMRKIGWGHIKIFVTNGPVLTRLNGAYHPFGGN
jgi:hypothetical protein